MKKFTIILLFLLVCMESKAQSTWWKEWFQQKKTQKEYLTAQVAALQAYIQVARDGYKIAQKGLNTIGNIKNGDFNLHRDFFSSLSGVNPAIRNYAKVADIMAMQLEIIRGYNRDYKSLQQDGTLNQQEMVYISGVYERLLDDCLNIIEELMMVTSDGTVQMKDDERIRRIDALYESMRGNKVFMGVFGSQAKILAVGKQKELQEIKASRSWNATD